jgi:DNA-directed RNA polymerase subunit RPC12/RpoP
MCDGNCLKECNCSYLIGTEDCKCTSGKHKHYKTDSKRFCCSECSCKLQNCATIEYCGDAYPAWYYKTSRLTFGDQCSYCIIFKVKFPKIKGNCYICSDDKYLIETYCNHHFCLECLMEINSDKEELDNPCPMCRERIEFNHF